MVNFVNGGSQVTMKYLSQKRPGSPWYVKLTVPEDVRHILGFRYVQSTKTTDLKTAKRVRDRLILGWKAEIDAARGNAYPELVNLPKDPFERAMAIEALESVAVDIAQDTGNFRPLEAVKKAQSMAGHIDKWQDNLNIKQATKDAYRRHVEALCEIFPDHRLITNKNVVRRALDQSFDYEASVSTKRQRIAAWISFIDSFQIEHGLMEDLVSLFKGHKIRSNKETKHRRPYTVEQVRELHKAANGPLKDLIDVCYSLGTRIEEAIRIESHDIDKENLTVHIRGTKTTGSDRVVPYGEALGPALERLAELPKTGGRMSNKYTKQFSDLKERLGFSEEYVFHSLRHTFVNILSAALVPEAVLDALVGHSSKDFTRRVYSGAVGMEHMREAIGHIPTLT